MLTGEGSIDDEGNYQVEGERMASRGLFLIARADIVRYQVVNDSPLGRSIRECLRVIDALQHFEEQGEVCPMDWQKSEKAMTADHQGVSDYLSNK